MRLLLIVFLSLASLKGFSQSCLNTEFIPIPEAGDFIYGWSSGLYSPDEFSIVGDQINGFNFELNTTSSSHNLENQRIYLRHHADGEFSSAEYPDATNFTLVFDGTISVAPGVVTVTFDQPFTYQGSGNIELLFENHSGNNYGGLDFRRTALATDGPYIGRYRGLDSWTGSLTGSRVQYKMAINGNCALVPLPINLVSFSANCRNSSVEVNWQVSMEANNDYFTLEFSEDAKNWIAINEIKSEGNTNEIRNYSVTHDQQYNNGFLRLSQTDLDGKQTFLKTIPVNCSRLNSSYNFNVAPNPFNDFIKISSDATTDDVNISIYNTLGQEVTFERLNQKGNNLLINTANFPNGLYIIKIWNNNGTINNYKVIK